MARLFHTSPSSDPLEFEAGGLSCTKVSLGSLDNNAYLLDARDGPLILIDAPAEADRLLALLGDRALGAVVTTHRHADHLQALAAVVAATAATAYAGRPDVAEIARSTGVASRPVWTGDDITCGQIRLDVIGLVGHTPGSIALVLQHAGSPTHIFTGDSLFPGGIGMTTTPADFTSLLDGVVGEVFEVFADETVVHPGHGDSTTLGTQRPWLGEWRARGW